VTLAQRVQLAAPPAKKVKTLTAHSALDTQTLIFGATFPFEGPMRFRFGTAPDIQAGDDYVYPPYPT
jgi:hypothetical protein